MCIRDRSHRAHASTFGMATNFKSKLAGFLVDKDFERQGIIKKGSQLINAVSNSTVPHITFIVGASYGAGTYAMSGKAYNNRFTFLWPTAKIAVMGPEQMAGVMSIVRKAKAKRDGKPFDEKADEQFCKLTQIPTLNSFLCLVIK